MVISVFLFGNSFLISKIKNLQKTLATENRKVEIPNTTYLLYIVEKIIKMLLKRVKVKYTVCLPKVAKVSAKFIFGKFIVWCLFEKVRTHFEQNP